MLAALGMMAWALRRDAAGATENLVSDLILLAFATVAVELFLVRRRRSVLSRDMRESLSSVRVWVDQLHQQVSEIEKWAQPQVAIPADPDQIRQMRFASAGPEVTITYWRPLIECLEDLAAVQGTMDLSFYAARSAVAYAQVRARLDRALDALARPVRPTSPPGSFEYELARLHLPVGAASFEGDDGFLFEDELNSALALLSLQVQPLLEDATLIHDAVVSGYRPDVVAEFRVPDRLPTLFWGSALAGGFVSLVALAWSAAEPCRFADGFASAVLGNLLPAGAGIGLGVAVAVIGSAVSDRRLVRRAAPHLETVFTGTTGLADALWGENPKRVERELRTLSTLVCDAVNQLQYVEVDPQLNRLAFLLQGSLNAYLTDTPATVLTPNAHRVAWLATQVGWRASSVYGWLDREVL